MWERSGESMLWRREKGSLKALWKVIFLHGAITAHLKILPKTEHWVSYTQWSQEPADCKYPKIVFVNSKFSP